jgi:hypothetical protein
MFSNHDELKQWNKLKAKNETRAAQREEQQIASPQQENTKQKKRGFEYGA